MYLVCSDCRSNTIVNKEYGHYRFLNGSRCKQPVSARDLKMRNERDNLRTRRVVTWSQTQKGGMSDEKAHHKKEAEKAKEDEKRLEEKEKETEAKKGEKATKKEM